MAKEMQCAQTAKISTYVHDDLLSGPSSLSKSPPFFGHEFLSSYLLKRNFLFPLVSVSDHGLVQPRPAKREYVFEGYFEALKGIMKL